MNDKTITCKAHLMEVGSGYKKIIYWNFKIYIETKTTLFETKYVLLYDLKDFTF